MILTRLLRGLSCIPAAGAQAWFVHYSLTNHKPFTVLWSYHGTFLTSWGVVVASLLVAACAAASVTRQPWASPLVGLASGSLFNLLLFFALHPHDSVALSNDFNEVTARWAFLGDWLASVGIGFAIAVPLLLVAGWLDARFADTGDIAD